MLAGDSQQAGTTERRKARPVIIDCYRIAILRAA